MRAFRVSDRSFRPIRSAIGYNYRNATASSRDLARARSESRNKPRHTTGTIAGFCIDERDRALGINDRRRLRCPFRVPRHNGMLTDVIESCARARAELFTHNRRQVYRRGLGGDARYRARVGSSDNGREPI